MKLRVFTAWLKAGLAATLLPAPWLVATTALAQAPTGPSLGPWPAISQPAPVLRPTLPPVVTEQRTAPTLPVAPIRGAEPDGDQPQIPEVTAETPQEPQQPRDGVLEPDEPQPVLDGLDPSQAETRPEEDVHAFTPPEPAAGYDPSQFSIDFDPVFERRPTLFTSLDPYAPTGIRLGTFLLYPEIEMGPAWFNNLLRTSSDRRSDVALETRPSARLLSTWGVHAIELNARGLASFHDELPSEDDRAWALEARGRLDVTRRTNVESNLGREVTQETRGTINTRAGTGGRSDVTTDRAGVALNHRFNRLSVQLRGAVAERDYAPSIENDGTSISNDDRDTRQQEVALRATWEFKPQLAVFGEVGTDARDFRSPGRSDGIVRDSSGERYRLGVSFGGSGQIIRGDISVGALKQSFDDGRLPEISGVIVDANLGWRITGLTSLLVTARSDVGESTVAGSGGALVRSVGAEVRHAFRRNVVGSAGIRLTRADYAGIDLVEQDVTTSLGVDYYLSREVSLFGRYAHIDFSSTSPQGDYTADEVRVGVRVRR